VLDLSTDLGAYCTKLLCDLGADVVKVEPPCGDPLRHRPPFADDSPSREGSLWHLYYHAGKRSITLELGDPRALEILRRLVARSDVVVLSPRADTPARLDHRWHEWCSDDGITCVLTPYGLTGPYRATSATHLTSCAMGGHMVKDERYEAPLAFSDQQLYDIVGTHAAIAILAAGRNRSEYGGQLVEIAVHDILASQLHAIQRFAVAGVSELQRYGPEIPPSGAWACRDGIVEFQVWEPRQWEQFYALIGSPPSLAGEDYGDRLVRLERADAIRTCIGPVLADRSKIDLMEDAQRRGVPCAAVNSPAEFLADEQVASRRFVARARNASLGDHAALRAFCLASEPLFASQTSAPLLGAHNDAIYVEELGYPRSELQTWTREGLV
jgi:crotonobetainyl-CoA:carnitine CoA-transferase CaiB-like acyl-CoA transferase